MDDVLAAILVTVWRLIVGLAAAFIVAGLIALVASTMTAIREVRTDWPETLVRAAS